MKFMENRLHQTTKYMANLEEWPQGMSVQETLMMEIRVREIPLCQPCQRIPHIKDICPLEIKRVSKNQMI